MKSIPGLRFVLYILIAFCVSACRPKLDGTRISDIPASVSQSESTSIDINVVVTSAEYQVQQMLPEAYLTLIVFSGKCQDLSDLHGTIGLEFAQVQSGILQRQILSGFVSVNTISQIMELHIQDLSDYYPTTKPLMLDNVLTAKDVAAVAEEYIISAGISACDVTMGYFGDHWNILCTELDSGPLGKRVCEFRIDPATLKIVGE